jgi:hypothetical protein
VHLKPLLAVATLSRQIARSFGGHSTKLSTARPRIAGGARLTPAGTKIRLGDFSVDIG